MHKKPHNFEGRAQSGRDSSVGPGTYSNKNNNSPEHEYKHVFARGDQQSREHLQTTPLHRPVGKRNGTSPSEEIQARPQVMVRSTNATGTVTNLPTPESGVQTPTAVGSHSGDHTVEESDEDVGKQSKCVPEIPADPKGRSSRARKAIVIENVTQPIPEASQAVFTHASDSPQELPIINETAEAYVTLGPAAATPMPTCTQDSSSSDAGPSQNHTITIASNTGHNSSTACESSASPVMLSNMSNERWEELPYSSGPDNTFSPSCQAGYKWRSDSGHVQSPIRSPMVGQGVYRNESRVPVRKPQAMGGQSTATMPPNWGDNGKHQINNTKRRTVTAPAGGLAAQINGTVDSESRAHTFPTGGSNHRLALESGRAAGTHPQKLDKARQIQVKGINTPPPPYLGNGKETHLFPQPVGSASSPAHANQNPTNKTTRSHWFSGDKGHKSIETFSSPKLAEGGYKVDRVVPGVRSLGSRLLATHKNHLKGALFKLPCF